MRPIIARVVVVLAVALVLAWFTYAPITRSYDAETGVMCYSRPAAIACVRP